jgi:hypothetical protein
MLARGPCLALALFAGTFHAYAEPRDAAAGQAIELFGRAGLGRGLRFNNPFRLRTQLGSDPESLSLTAPYLDLTTGAAFGPPNALLHGGALALSIALEGVPQEVLTPSYVALFGLPPRWVFLGRAGTPIIIQPDANLGFELAAAAAFLVSAGMGVTAELAGSLFYGAATPDVSTTIVPVASFELGLWLSYEILR